MNFATLPPEILSGRVHEGPGSATMIESVTAWEALAIRLCTAAADYRAVTAKLAKTSPAAAAMIEAAAPFIDWLDAAAARAQQAATHARAAATAFDTALAATVPPAVIHDNRARKMALAKANRLGQSSAAIAQTESEYEQMWARDVDAMYAYAGASAEASTIAPFTSPPGGQAVASGPWILQSAPELVSCGHPVMAAIPEALQGLSLSPPTTLDACLAPVTPALSKLSSLTAPSGLAIGQLNSLNKAAALRWLLPDHGGPGIVARFGRAPSDGTLSVPPAWATGAAAGTASAVFRAG